MKDHAKCVPMSFMYYQSSTTHYWWAIPPVLPRNTHRIPSPGRSDARNLAPDAVMFPAGIPKHTLDGIFTGLTGRNLQEPWFQMGLDSSGFLVYPKFRYVTQTSQEMKTGCVWFSLALSFRFLLACCTPSCVFKLLRVDVPTWHPSDLGCWCVAWNQLFVCFRPFEHVNVFPSQIGPLKQLPIWIIQNPASDFCHETAFPEFSEFPILPSLQFWLIELQLLLGPGFIQVILRWLLNFFRFSTSYRNIDTHPPTIESSFLFRWCYFMANLRCPASFFRLVSIPTHSELFTHILMIEPY